MEIKGNPTVESFVRYYTDDYQLRMVAIKDTLQPTWGVQNRPTKIDTASVEEMAYSHMVGIALPPIVVRVTEKGRLEIIDGNHRAQMCRGLDVEEFPAYVANVDDATFERMVTRANRTNGRSLSTPIERLHLAVQDVGLGVPLGDAASAWGVEKSQVSAAMTERRGRENFVAANVKGVRINKSQAAVFANMEPDHIKALGKEIENATVQELQAAKRAIHSAPSAERQKQAEIQSEELKRHRGEREGKPGNDKPFTMAKARSLLTQLEAGLKQNADVAANDVVIGRIYKLWVSCSAQSAKRQRAAEDSLAS